MAWGEVCDPAGTKIRTESLDLELSLKMQFDLWSLQRTRKLNVSVGFYDD